MILDVDAGNSRLKWRLSRRDGIVIESGHCNDESGLDSLKLESGDAEPLERIRVASVRGEVFASRLRELARKSWQLSPEFAVPAGHCAGVTNAYESPQALGVDRWLAVLAAFNDCRSACCVVDVGSAATLDLVSADGNHLGGYIVPGLAMQKRSLLQGTAMALSARDEWPGNLQPGKNTMLAVHGGILAMLVDWVQHEYRAAAVAGDCLLYLTGGDATLLSPHLSNRDIAHIVEPDLVLDGLASALP